MDGQDVYSAMQTGEPFKSYRKTILGKVFVLAWDSFTNKSMEIRLFGKPEESIIDVWSEREDSYFKKANKRFFEAGVLMPVDRKKLPPQPEVKVYTDDELAEIIKSKFYSLRKVLNSIKDKLTVTRMLEIAKDMEASQKIIGNIEARLSEIETAEFHMPTTETVKETKE